MTGAGVVALDQSTAAFLQGGVVTVVASRSASNVPSLAYAWAVSVSDDRRRVRIVVPGDAAAAVLADIAAGAPVAAVFGQPTTCRTVQVKGGSARVVPLVPGEAERVAARNELVRRELTAIGESQGFIAAVVDTDPARFAAFEFEVGSVYSQTPGPGAGAKVAG